jgi:uncharacterized damage-inducible protein DinB
MQRSAEIRDLLTFNRWANARMRAAVAQLSDEEITRDLRSSYPSVRATVLHVMASEWVWLTRWLGTSPPAMPDVWNDYSWAQIEVEWSAIETAQKAYIDNLADQDLDRVIAYRNFKGESHSNPLWQLLRHVVNHSSYHRGQITTMLRQLGRQPSATDLVLYYRQQQATIAQ